MRFLSLLLILVLVGCSTPKVLKKEADPYSWLENVEGDKALTWVKSKNKATLSKFAHTKDYSKLENKALELLQAKDKIPYVAIRGDHLYNFWQDAKHVRGLLRRTTYASFKKSKPQWETVLDIDQLAKTEKENWVYKGMTCLKPAQELCMVSLSRGGKDATVKREFNTSTKSFVTNGFKLPEAKSWVSWLDKDQLMVNTDFGKGTLTESGYARLQKVWKRGTPLASAKTIFEAKVKDMGVWGSADKTPGGEIALVNHQLTFFTSKIYTYHDGKLTQLPKQDSADYAGYFQKHIVLRLRKDWQQGTQKFPAGSLVAMKEQAAKTGEIKPGDLTLLYKPDGRSSVQATAVTKNSFLINVLENVQGKIYSVGFNNNTFTQPIPLNIPGNGNVSLSAYSPFAERIFFSYEGFLKPEALYAYNLSTNSKLKVKSLPKKFNATGMVVQQNWATSKDGTRVPYFVVGKQKVISKGDAPTLLYGYGGFEVARTPTYNPITGKMWLEKGGIYVVANIRGGGEFGPKWHQAALKTRRQKAFDDFIAVGEDLIRTKVTSREHLAIYGGSNGGLLVGTVMTQRPDLFKGVVCLVPLLDMARFHQLLAGASWMAEYGDPRETREREFLLSYSPYHNVTADKQYPDLFLMTSTKDDRVHPGHARKMAAKMSDLGHTNLFYYENTEGGHAASANLKQRAKMKALQYSFLYNTIW